MKKVLLLCMIVAAALSVQSAKADEFSISFDGGSLGYSGAGVFVGTYNSSESGYDITSVLYGLVSDPGFGTSSIVSLSTYAGADQILYFPGGPSFDGNGLSFELANGVDINLYDTFVDPYYFDSALQSNPGGDIAEPAGFTVTETPEPSSFILFGTAALGLAGLLRRRLVA
jgi:hypothetical protein